MWARRALGVALLALPVVLLLPPLRAPLEATMARQMLLQIPLVVGAGWWLAVVSPARWHREMQTWNPGGVAGLVLAVVLGAVVMTPRVLDAATYNVGDDALKLACAFGCGIAAGASWQPAGIPGQAFVVGNVCWMLAAAGLLLRDWPQRVCAAYLEQDQRIAGTGLVLWAVTLALLWLVPQLRRRRALPL
jgi:hypothetical protein